MILAVEMLLRLDAICPPSSDLTPSYMNWTHKVHQYRDSSIPWENTFTLYAVGSYPNNLCLPRSFPGNYQLPTHCICSNTRPRCIYSFQYLLHHTHNFEMLQTLGLLLTNKSRTHLVVMPLLLSTTQALPSSRYCISFIPRPSACIHKLWVSLGGLRTGVYGCIKTWAHNSIHNVHVYWQL